MPTFAAGVVALATLVALERIIGMLSRWDWPARAVVHNRPALLIGRL